MTAIIIILLLVASFIAWPAWALWRFRSWNRVVSIKAREAQGIERRRCLMWALHFNADATAKGIRDGEAVPEKRGYVRKSAIEQHLFPEAT